MNKEEYLAGKKSRIRRSNAKLVIATTVLLVVGIGWAIGFKEQMTISGWLSGAAYGALIGAWLSGIPLEVRKFIAKAIEAYQD